MITCSNGQLSEDGRPSVANSSQLVVGHDCRGINIKLVSLTQQMVKPRVPRRGHEIELNYRASVFRADRLGINYMENHLIYPFLNNTIYSVLYFGLPYMVVYIMVYIFYQFYDVQTYGCSFSEGPTVDLGRPAWLHPARAACINGGALIA